MSSDLDSALAASGDADARIAALEDNLFSQWSQFGRPASCALEDRDGVLRFDTPIASLPYNGVVRTRCGADVEDRIDAILAHYDTRGVPFFWVVHPTSAPDDLDARLAARGLTLAEIATGMIARPDAIAPLEEPPDGVEIRPVTPDDEDLVLEFVAARWSVPSDAIPHLRDIFRTTRIGHRDGGMRGWIALHRGRLIGKGFTHRSGRVIGLYGVATKPEARGRGVARALCLRALHESASPETEHCVLHASAMAASLYRKMGFEEAAAFRIFVHGAEFHL